MSASQTVEHNTQTCACDMCRWAEASVYRNSSGQFVEVPPLVHAPLRSPAEVEHATVEQRFESDWDAAPSLTRDDWESAFYWWLKGRQSGAAEVVAGDVEEMRRLVGERMER